MSDIMRCEMTDDCAEEVAYLDVKGYIYCAKHGQERQAYQRCRKLTAAELKRIARGIPLARY